MTQKSLKSRASKGMIWNALESFSVQGGQFLTSIVLTRFLLPTDFGLIGMLAIFIAISQSFINSGMGTALVQKKDRAEIDYSTVFVFNFTVSAIIYLILFFAAPLIAQFYAMPQLTLLTRILTLNIIIDSLALVQIARLIVNLDFKTLAKINLIAVIISGISAILLANFGFGVWALVFQNIIRSIVTVSILWVLSEKKFSLKFSKRSFYGLFGFGSKLLGASLIATFFANIYKIIIGKLYSVSDLGYYTQANQFSGTISGTVASVLQRVTFPILSSIQDDELRMVAVYRRIMRMTSFVIFPIMTLFALLADPFIRFFLNEKWLNTIPLLQILCIAQIFYPISALNMNILTANGRSDLFLKVDMAKIPILVISFVITIPLGLKAVVIGFLLTSLITFFVDTYMPGKLFNYGPFAQIRDMATKIAATMLMAILVYFVLSFIHLPILKLVIGGFTGLLGYLVICSIMRIEEVSEVGIMIKNIRRV